MGLNPGGGASDFVILHNFQTGSGAIPASWSVGKGDLSLGLSGRGLKLPAHIYLVQRLRMIRALPPFPLYSIIV